MTAARRATAAARARPAVTSRRRLLEKIAVEDVVDRGDVHLEARRGGGQRCRLQVEEPRRGGADDHVRAAEDLGRDRGCLPFGSGERGGDDLGRRVAPVVAAPAVIAHAAACPDRRAERSIRRAGLARARSAPSSLRRRTGRTPGPEPGARRTARRPAAAARRRRRPAAASPSRSRPRLRGSPAAAGRRQRAAAPPAAHPSTARLSRWSIGPPGTAASENAAARNTRPLLRIPAANSASVSSPQGERLLNRTSKNTAAAPPRAQCSSSGL